MSKRKKEQITNCGENISKIVDAVIETKQNGNTQSKMLGEKWKEASLS